MVSTVRSRLISCVRSGLRFFFLPPRAISPFLLAKDTSIVNAVNERFGLADRAYVAERKYKAHMGKIDRAQATINDVGRKFGLSSKTMYSAGKQFNSSR